MRRVPRRASAPGRIVGGMRWVVPLNRRAVPVAGVARSMAEAGAASGVMRVWNLPMWLSLWLSLMPIRPVSRRQA